MIKRILASMTLAAMAFTIHAAPLEYTYPLYPYTRDLSQTLTFKVMLRCALPEQISNMDMALVANYLRQIDCVTRGLPKVVVLGGFQRDGHDHTYPWWTPVDDNFTAPGRRRGKAALLWLMEEARKYHTDCTFHVNPFDAYEDSEKWALYEEKDLLCRNLDGSLVKGDVWWGRQSYFVNMVNEWNAGITQQRIDELVEELPLVKETGVLYFDNLTQYPASPKHRVTKSDQITGIKKAAEYLMKKYGIQLIGEYADVNLYGIGSLGVTWDWFASLNINQMEVPAYVACGGRNICHDDLLGASNDISKRRLQVFGSSIQLEDIQFQHDVSKVVREFTHHTLPYFYMNRQLRTNLATNGYEMNLTLTDGIESKWESDNVHRIYRDGNLIKEDYDVFIPVYWVNHPEIMAYSYKGRNGEWSMPKEWSAVKAVDIYEFDSSFYNLVLKERGVAVTGGKISLNLEAGVAKIIVPTGTDINDGTIYDNPAAGSVEFLGEDRESAGDWKGKYGAVGYDIFGAAVSLPDDVAVSHIGSNLETYESSSTRPEALRNPLDGASRIEAVRTSRLHHIIDVNTAENRQVTVYLADYKNRNIQMAVDVIDPATQKVLDSRIVNSLQGGVYLKYNIEGHLRLRFTRFFYDGYGNPDYPVCSAVFIDEPGESSVVRVDYDADMPHLDCHVTPAGDGITIEARSVASDHLDMTIYSVSGRQFFSGTFGMRCFLPGLTLDRQMLGVGNGVYIVTLTAGNSSIHKKIIFK